MTDDVAQGQMLCAVSKLRVSYRDDIGNLREGTGSGFWLTTNRGTPIFVTNRHNVDPAMLTPLGPKYSLASLSIALRAFDTTVGLPCGNTHSLELDNGEFRFYPSCDGSDVALLTGTTLRAPQDSHQRLFSFVERQLTYSRRPMLLDQLYFIGFPGRDRADARYGFPIARGCVIASFPEIDYFDEDPTIKSKDVCLVEGLSFGGSSGSVVIRGGREGLVEVMGIMSGHFPGEEWGQGHSGLSYFTKATAIASAIRAHGL